jgi:hypothetical protein
VPPALHFSTTKRHRNGFGIIKNRKKFGQASAKDYWRRPARRRLGGQGNLEKIRWPRKKTRIIDPRKRG